MTAMETAPPRTGLELSQAVVTGAPSSFWRSLSYFNFYRLGVALVLLASVALVGENVAMGSANPRLYYGAGIAYLVSGLVFTVMIRSRRLPFDIQLSLQVAADVGFIILMLRASGGIQSGLGLLLLPALAAAGLISRGRLTLFFAAIASIAVLLEMTYAQLIEDRSSSEYFQAGLLCIGYFATAWLAHALAKRTVESEQLARDRGIRLANMAQINQLVIQDMQDGVLVLDEAGGILQRNHQAERLLGIDEDAPPDPDVGEMLPALGERLTQWRENPETRFELLRIPRTNRLVRTRFVPIRAGAAGGAVLFLEDMSRIQSQAQQLKLAALGRLTANIAHEIRNPLSAINHATELLQEEEGLNATQARLLGIVRDNTRRLERMVKEVLQLNRRDRANPEVFSPMAFLRTFIDEFGHGERIPPEAFGVEVATTRTLCFDRGHLNQVLWNLCSNAWRHGKKANGSIQLVVSDGVTPNQVCVDVIDDGPGVPAEARGQLFEPFFTTAKGGTGLGLYIAREICDANGASLECLESEGGAHFRMVCRRDHVKAQRASDQIRPG